MRKDDLEDQRHYRSADRLFLSDGRWFYETREGDRGPFPSRQEAQLELQRYVSTCEYFEEGQDEGPETGASGIELSMLDPDDY